MKFSDRHISDEELDQLFRDSHAAEGQESLFVPEFWSEVEAMLPADKKPKLGLYWIPLAASLLITTFLLFYPSRSAQIDSLNRQNHVAKEDLNSTESVQSEQVVAAEDLQTQPSNESIAMDGKKKSQSPFKISQKEHASHSVKQLANPSQDLQIVQVDVPSQELEQKIQNDSENFAVVPKVDEGSDKESELIHLEPRNERIIHEEIAALPKSSSIESNQWYLELGPTLGQSPYLSPNQKRNAVGGAVLGAGYMKRIDNAFVSMGVQARLEGFGGLNYQETNFSQNIVRTVSVKQLYSFEVPLKFGYACKRSEFSFAVVPGVQLFIHGKEKIVQNQIVQREESFTGKVEHSNSLTMEIGFQYYYNFSSRFGIGAKLNADILRPFHTDYYLGKSAGFPMNGQIVLRRIISK